MSNLPSRERVEELIEYFGGHLSDMEESDKEAAKEDDPNGLIHPIYLSNLCGHYYRDLLSILYDYQASQDKEDKPGACIADRTTGVPGPAIGAHSVEEGSTPSPGSPSAEDERALVRLGRCVRDLDAAMREKHYPQNPDNQSAINHLRSRISSPPQRKVTREWADELFYKATLGTSMGPYKQRMEHRDEAIAMLRDLGIEVEDK